MPLNKETMKYGSVNKQQDVNAILFYSCTNLILMKLGVKTRWELYKDTACYFERIWEAAVRPLTPISQITQVRRTKHPEQR